MSLSQDIGQLMIIGVSGTSLTADEKKFIIENGIGGVVLFGRNCKSPDQIHALCSEIQALRHHQAEKTPLFISVDMEGGRVARLKSPFTQWPPLKLLGDLDSPTMAFNMAHAMGAELKAAGINLDFAPCADVFTNPKNTVIGDRSASTDPEQVAKIISALIRGYIKAEIISCVKHFPGHGNTLLDSHEELPIEEVEMARLEATELVPFKKAFKSRVEMVMSAHIRYTKIDPKWPATLSETILKKLLRDNLRYRGLIITDDLDMKAMTKNYSKEEIPVRAIEAGADLLLYCNEPESPVIAVDSIAKSVAEGRLDGNYIRAQATKIKAFKKEHLVNADPIPFTEASKIIGHQDHFKLAQAIASGQVIA